MQWQLVSRTNQTVAIYNDKTEEATILSPYLETTLRNHGINTKVSTIAYGTQGFGAAFFQAFGKRDGYTWVRMNRSFETM